MGAGVVRLYTAPALGVHASGEAVADAELSALDLRPVEVVALDRRVRIFDARQPVFGFEYAGVADLPARFGVKRRAVEHDLSGLSGREGFALFVPHDDRQHARAGRFGPVVPGELGLRNVGGGASVNLSLFARG